MARQPRPLAPDTIYHVTVRGNNRLAVFLDSRDKDRYINLIAEIKSAIPCRLYHFALMDNHVHLILHAETIESLPAFMKSLGERYAMYFRRRHGGTGHLWGNRYKSFVIHDDSYLLTCGAYIELNPVRGGLVADPGEYRWSSYRHYAFGEKHRIVDESIIYESSGGSAKDRQESYRNVVLGWQIIKK